MRARTAGVLLGLVVLLPRLARVLHPDLWDEDTFALASARLHAGGAQPYRDFDAPYPPTVEHVLALLFRLFGTNVRTAELATQAMQAGSALLLGLATRRAFGAGAGIATAALFGFSALVFRYHLFEHEVPAAFALSGAFAICAQGPPPSFRRRLALTACLSLALLAKATVAPAVAGVLAWHLFSTREARATLRFGLFAVLPLGIVALVYAGAFGSEFWLQSAGLHLVKGSTGNFVDRLRFLAREVDLTLAAGICGGLAALRAPRGSLVSLAVFAGLFEGAFALLFKTTLWAHNLFPLLVPASVLGGSGLARAARAIRRPTRGGLAVGVLFLGLAANGLRHARAVAVPGREATYGFGFFPRADLERLAGEIRAACPPGLAVEGASPLYGFAADRDPAVAFAEFRGVLGELRGAIARTGLLGAIRARRARAFWPTIEACFPLYADALAERVRRGEVGALVFEPDAALRIARALAERGVACRLDPEPLPGPREPRVYRVLLAR